MILDDELIYDVADFYKMFGESSRIKILYALLEKEMTVTEIVGLLSVSQPAVSHQLRILRQGGLVKHRKEGKSVLYSLDDNHVESLLRQGLEHIMHKGLKYMEKERE